MILCCVLVLLVGEDPVGQAHRLFCHVLLSLVGEDPGSSQVLEVLAQGVSEALDLAAYSALRVALILAALMRRKPLSRSARKRRTRVVPSSCTLAGPCLFSSVVWRTPCLASLASRAAVHLSLTSVAVPTLLRSVLGAAVICPG